MAWYLGATKREIRPGENDPPIKPIGLILHVDAGNHSSLYDYFNGPSGGIESHFHVPKAVRPEQYRSTGYEADANYKANSFVEDGVRKGYISVETQGFGDGEWNAHQVDEIKKLILWAHETHGIPLRKCSGPRDPGIGYHTLFRDWYPEAKSCPGPDRIRQYNNVLVPWLADATTPPKEWDEMASQEEIRWAVRAVVKEEVYAQVRPMAVQLQSLWSGEVNRDAEAIATARKSAVRIEALFGHVLRGQGVAQEDIDAILAKLNEESACAPNPS